MGTNFSLKDDATHVGKRSAAGLYCWDCMETLCESGVNGVHFSAKFYEVCPVCGKNYVNEDMAESSGGRELGFNKSAPAPKVGVKTCSSFSWAMLPEDVEALSREGVVIVDEYGVEYTRAEFFMVLSECPIKFHRMIGKEFC